MNKSDNLVWSSLILLFGSVIALFGQDLHAQNYQHSYETVLHWHVNTNFVVWSGTVLVIVGLVGLAVALFSNQD